MGKWENDWIFSVICLEKNRILSILVSSTMIWSRKQKMLLDTKKGAIPVMCKNPEGRLLE